MKLLSLFALFIAVAFIFAAGYITMTKTKIVNATASAGFSTLSNTSDPFLNTTITAPAGNPPQVNGSLRVSISGILYPANLSVVLDNETVGTVTPVLPLYLKVSEGNHTVMVCDNPVCEEETVTTRFGRYTTVDFSDRLLKDVKFPNPTAQPTAQILDYCRNGNVVSVYVEFVNPKTTDHTISVDLSIGYTYIDGRSHVKLGDATQAKTELLVKAGQREIKQVDMFLTDSNPILSFGNPVIEDQKVK